MGFKLNNFYKKTNKEPSPLNLEFFTNSLTKAKKFVDDGVSSVQSLNGKLTPYVPDVINQKKLNTLNKLDGENIGRPAGPPPVDNSGVEFTPELNDLISKREKLVPGTNEYLINQNKINELMGSKKRYKVDEPVNIEPAVTQSEPSDTVTSTITGEPVNVMDRGQIRAARRADRLERKEIRKGRLTPGQARRLQKNKDVISRETRDRTKMGDVVQSVGSLFKKSPMNANKPVGAVGLDEVVVKASDKKSRVKHRLSKTRKKKNEATGAKKERLEKREQRLMKRRDKNTEKAAKDISKGKKVYSKKEGKEKRGK
tara:strand:- start:62 stop:1000 length:939 start_codon:yes stop_codon:yes gene_type:complete